MAAICLPNSTAFTDIFSPGILRTTWPKAFLFSSLEINYYLLEKKKSGFLCPLLISGVGPLTFQKGVDWLLLLKLSVAPPGLAISYGTKKWLHLQTPIPNSSKLIHPNLRLFS